MKLLKQIIEVIVIFLIAFACSYMYNYTVEQYKNGIYEQNIKVLQDSIDYYEVENDKIVATKLALQSDYDDLKLLNEDLYDNIDELKIKNKILASSHVNGNIEYEKFDTIYKIKHDTIRDFCYDFKNINKWRCLEGTICGADSIISFNINKDIVNFDFTSAIDDKGRFYIKSDNPYVKYRNLDVCEIPKPKHTNFAIGPMVGAGYGIVHNKFDVFVGLSITWKLWNF